MEHFWRGLSNDKDKVSAIPPYSYGDRFFNFIRGLVKSPEEAAREKQNKETQAAEGSVQANEAIGSDVRTSTEDAHPHRSMGTVRSPSAERTGGAAGTILPVVEEVGEGSSSGRSGNHSSSGTDSDHSVEPQYGPVRHNGDETEMTIERSGRSYASKPDSAISIDEPVLRQKREPEQQQSAFRMAHVSS